MTVSLLAPQFGTYLPPANPPGLSDQEQSLVVGLSTKLSVQAVYMNLRDAYYNGLQRLQDLGISIPPQLAGVRTVVDWPRICIDPLVQRAVVDGFRLPGSTDVDEELWGLWQANDMDAEAPLAFLDSLVFGRGYMIVGSPDDDGDDPVITVESPLNVTMTWDPRTRRTLAAYQSYQVEGVYRAVLYLPDATVAMSRDQSGQQWVVDFRDEHNFGEVPVVRFANRQRSGDREGHSEITPAVMNTTDSACRSLLGMEIAREFYSVPSRYALNVKEEDFQNADGTVKTAIDMAMNKFLAFTASEDGNEPKLGQFTAFDPSVFTKIVDEHAQLMASYTQFPPAYFGQTSTANPASADAIRVAENGVNRRGEQVQNQWSDPLERVMGLAWRFANGGAALPPEMKRLETDWCDVATPTPAATADAIFKQVQMGAIPATSDVTLKALGWSAVQRVRLDADRKLDAGAAELAELATSLQAKQARTDITVPTDITGHNPNTPPPASGPAKP